jgi:biopolymer transport protein ExbD
MTWKIRHQGSPQSIGNLTLAQVIEGLQDGLWEPTDEVMGPQDADWVAIENHPQLAEIAADIEPPPPRHYDDETHLDMTALIDVCLVLLVFFILTTSYALIAKRLDLPNVSTDAVGLPKLTKEQVENQMIHVIVKMQDGKPVYVVEGTPVDGDSLTAALAGFVRQRRMTTLLLEHSYEVPHGAVVHAQDCAYVARMDRVLLVVPESELKK